MNYGTFSVYTYVANAINANEENENCYVTSRRERIPRAMPCVCLYELNRQRTQRYATLANDDNQYESTYEAQIYCDEINGSMLKAYEILGIVESAFKKLGYFETFCQPLDNMADASISRILARFNKQIGEGDEIPESN